MNTVQAITESLSKVFHDLTADEIDAKKADALANVAGKIIKANMGQLAYYEQRKDLKPLPFWEQKIE